MKYYYELTKSGLVLGNVVTVVAGFLLGTQAAGANSIDFLRLLATIIGITFVMASGCVFNNYIDRDIDAKMERTKHRALVTHRISAHAAIVYGEALAAIGFLALFFFANMLAFLAALVGFIFYVFVYSLWGKRATVYGTAMGAVAGAMPPVVGYAAASGRLDLAALILFLIMIAWQMPHFFAIAIRRKDDYAAAGIPVMPVKHSLHRTKVSMLTYIVEFIATASLLYVFGYAGLVYLAITLALGLSWFVFGVKGLFIRTDAASTLWARQMFLFSLFVMMVLFITITAGAVAWIVS